MLWDFFFFHVESIKFDLNAAAFFQENALR